MTRSSSPFYVTAIVSIVGLLVLDTIILAGYFSRPAQIQSFLEPELGNTLHIEESELRFDEGLILSGVRLFSAGSSSSQILSLERVRIGFNPINLLRGQMAPSEVTIERPEFTLRKMRDGRLNVQHFLDDLPGRKPAPDQPETGGKDVQLNTNVSITGGTLILRDLPSLLREERQLTLRNMDVDLRPIRNGAGVIVNGDATGTLDRISFNGQFLGNSLSLQATAHSLMVRKELIDLFSAEVRDVWSKYRATGPAKITYQLEHEFSGEQLDIPASAHSLTVHPRGMDASFVEFPYPMENLRGMMQFESDGLSFEFRSTIDRASFSINGHTDGYGERAELNVGIQAENVPIDNDLYTALEPVSDVRSFVRSLNPEGTVNATGSVSRQEGHEDVTFLIRVFPQGISLTYDEFPYPMKNVNGSVIIEPEQVRLENVEATPAVPTGTTEQSRAQMNGTIEFPEEESDDSTSFQLQVNAASIPLEDTLKQNLPDPVQNTWDQLQPEGSGSAQWSIHQSPGMNTPRHSIDVSLKNCTLRPVVLNQPVTNVSADVRYQHERVTLSGVTGNWNEGTVSIKTGQIGTSAGKPRALFQVSAKNLPINPSLKNVVFDDETLRDGIKNEGTLDLSGSIRWFQQREVPEIEYYMSLNVDGLGFTNIVDIEDIQGNMVLKGENDRENGITPTLTGGVDLTSMTVNGVQLSSFQSNMILQNDKLKLLDPNAQLLSGSLQGGHLHLNLADESFSIGVNTTGLSLQELFSALDIEERNLSGTMYGNAELRGQLTDASSWTGKGDFELRDAQLWRLPLLLSVLTKLSISKQKPFTNGRVRFDVKNRKVCLRQARLESPSSRLTGQGWVAFDGRQLIGLKIQELDPIISVPIIGWVYGQLTSNLFPIKATGTIMEPTVNVQPIPNIFSNNVGCSSE